MIDTYVARVSDVARHVPNGTPLNVLRENSGKCIDDTNWSSTAIDLHQWSCSGSSNQSFRFYPIGSSTPVSVQRPFADPADTSAAALRCSRWAARDPRTPQRHSNFRGKLISPLREKAE